MSSTRHTRWLGHASVAGLAMAALGCSSRAEPTPATAPVTVPETWQAAPSAGPITPWLTELNQPGLVAAVETAWVHNPDLRAAAARLLQAGARAEQAGAPRWPQVDAFLDASRARSNVEFGGEPQAVYASNYQLGLRVSWEADLWGRLAAAEAASAADATAAQADLDAARLSLAANVARLWFRVTHAELQRDLDAEFLTNQRLTLQVFQSRLRDGVGNALDVNLARANVAGAEADLAASERELDGLRRELEILLGSYPAAAISAAADLPAIGAELMAGLPADTLARRPDLRAAAGRLLAADHRLAQAEADLLPRLSLTASGGTASDDLRDLVDPEYLVWNLVGNLLGPLFDGGRRRAVVAERDAQILEAAERYAGLALTALREVESALAAEAMLRAELDARRRAETASDAAVQVSRSRYRDGLSEGADLLRDQRTLISQRRAVLQIRLASLLNRIDLYLALGGEPLPGPPPAADPGPAADAEPAADPATDPAADAATEG